MENATKIFDRISELMRNGEEFALATITRATKGSPRKSGTRMIVFGDGRTEFTIGGGGLEKRVIKESCQAIKKNRNINLDVEFKPSKSGMVCGGVAHVFIEVFKSGHKVVIFGGGHIGLALSMILDILGMPYIVIDDREDFASSQRFPNARQVRCLPYDGAAKKLNIDENTFCVIVTHGHKNDTQILGDLLGSRAAYVGMIGSSTKVRTVLKQLEKEGKKIDKTNIYAPVGLDIGGDSPQEIALAISAEILKVKYKRGGRSLRENPGKGEKS